jgi:predicted TIM-barrel fold metal-dependent hydrolase
MIVDVHGHLMAPQELYTYKEFLLGTRGHYGRGLSVFTSADNKLDLSHGRTGKVPRELVLQHAEEHIRWLDAVGTDVQLISARPYTLMHSEKPGKIVHWWTELLNNIIATQMDAFPNRLQGVANLPQVWGEPVSVVFDELDRCVNELGFVGVLLNPDPSEGRARDVPPLGHDYWYPLYEKLVQYDLPAVIHSTACVSERESQSLHFIVEESIAVLSLAQERVWESFPNLKIIVPHGGGAIPYQVGRFRGTYWDGVGHGETFDDAIKQMYFDTSLYSEDAVALLFKVMGPDHVVLGTERPGDGSHRRSASGHWADDLRSVIADLPGYSDEDKQKVYGDNAMKLFSRLKGKVDAGFKQEARTA